MKVILYLFVLPPCFNAARSEGRSKIMASKAEAACDDLEQPMGCGEWLREQDVLDRIVEVINGDHVDGQKYLEWMNYAEREARRCHSCKYASLALRPVLPLLQPDLFDSYLMDGHSKKKNTCNDLLTLLRDRLPEIKDESGNQIITKTALQLVEFYFQDGASMDPLPDLHPKASDLKTHGLFCKFCDGVWKDEEGGADYVLTFGIPACDVTKFCVIDEIVSEDSCQSMQLVH